jgi:hypothetical protein
MATQRPSHIDIPSSDQSDGGEDVFQGNVPHKHIPPAVNPDFKREFKLPNLSARPLLPYALLTISGATARGILKNAQSSSYGVPQLASLEIERQQGDQYVTPDDGTHLSLGKVR